MSFRFMLVLAATLGLGGCDWLNRPAFPDKAGDADASTAVSATADYAFAETSASAGGATDDEDESWIEDVSFPADATPVPKAGDFTTQTTVYHRKSPYFETSLMFQGDFRSYPDAFLALYRVHQDSLDGMLQTYGGRNGQNDSSHDEITLDAVTPRLLTVTVDSWEYTGGAHGNGSTSIEIWDRKAKSFIKAEDIFIKGRSVPEADELACTTYLKHYESTKREAVGCGDYFKYLEFGGFTEHNHRITGVLMITWPAYAMGQTCAPIPYRLFKASVKPGWQDQFDDDPDFVAHTKDLCPDNA